MTSSRRIAVVGYPSHAMTSRIVARLRHRGHSVLMVEPDQLVTDANRDGVVVRPFDREQLPDALLLTVSTDQVAAIASAREIEAKGVPVFNSPQAVLNASDKAETARLLARAGIAVPRTISLCSERAAIREARRMGYPLVLKASDGSEGEQVALVEHEVHLVPAMAGIRMSLSHAPSVGTLLVLQEVVAHSLGRDRRLFVAGGEVQASMDRVARPGEWRSNMSQGASGKAAAPTDVERSLAVRSTEALGLDFATVDMMETEQGPVVIEANAFGDVLDVGVVSGIDVIGSLADLAEMKAGARPLGPVRPRRLSAESKEQLAAFCGRRLQNKRQELAVRSAGPSVQADGVSSSPATQTQTPKDWFALGT